MRLIPIKDTDHGYEIVVINLCISINVLLVLLLWNFHKRILIRDTDEEFYKRI